MTDEELIAFCNKQDRKAQSILYQRYVSSMARLCLRYVNDAEEAKDVITEGFLKVFLNLKKFEFRGKVSLEVWIRKIMVNECLMHLRKKKIVFLEISEANYEINNSFEDDASAEEIYRMVRSLPNGYRTVFNLFVIEGYNHLEISKMLGITESCSRSQLSHAKQKLKQLLNAQGWN